MGVELSIDRVSFSYGEHRVLNNVSFTAQPGEVIGLVGPNGTGKSTLMKCVLGMLSPADGGVSVEGIDVRSMKPNERAKIISYVPQTLAAMFPATVFDTVMLGRRPHLYWKPTENDERIVAAAIARLGLEDLAFRDVTTLSGGERQRVLVARAFAQEAQVMLLDEPTASLDIRHQVGVLADVAGEVRERSLVGIVAIHDLNLASRFCHRLVLINQGRVFAEGNPRDVVTEENVWAAYRARVTVIACHDLPVIVPLAPTAASFPDPEATVGCPDWTDEAARSDATYSRPARERTTAGGDR